MAPKRKHSEIIATAAVARPRRATSRQTPVTIPEDHKETRTVKPKRTKPSQTPEDLKAQANDGGSGEAATVSTSSKPKGRQKPASTKKPENAAAIGDPSDERSYWLMKAEPESRIEKGIDVRFSIDDLAACTEPEPWDGVRNLAARNNMRAMKKGDLAFFYHSNCKTPGVVGIMEVVEEHAVDESAFDSSHPYFDEKSSRDSPKWFCVRVAFRQKFESLISLKELQKHNKGDEAPLKDMQVLRMSRLSVSKVSPKEWDFVLGLAGVDPNSL